MDTIKTSYINNDGIVMEKLIGFSINMQRDFEGGFLWEK
jgi:hypothetical protein